MNEKNTPSADTKIRLMDLLSISGNQIIIDLTLLLRVVDNRVDGGSVAETPEERRTRLRERVGQEKAKGTRAYLRTVSEEEGVSISRLKQLIKRPQPNSTKQRPRY